MTLSRFFEIIAREWDKPREKLQKFEDKFEEEMIENVADLISLSENSVQWEKMTESFPMGMTNRIMAKLTEITAATNQTGAYPFEHKECWIFYESEYDIIRTMEGNEVLGDLPATIEDAKNATNIALNLGVPK